MLVRGSGLGLAWLGLAWLGLVWFGSASVLHCTRISSPLPSFKIGLPNKATGSLSLPSLPNLILCCTVNVITQVHTLTLSLLSAHGGSVHRSQQPEVKSMGILSMPSCTVVQHRQFLKEASLVNLPLWLHDEYL